MRPLEAPHRPHGQPLPVLESGRPAGTETCQEKASVYFFEASLCCGEANGRIPLLRGSLLLRGSKRQNPSAEEKQTEESLLECRRGDFEVTSERLRSDFGVTSG